MKYYVLFTTDYDSHSVRIFVENDKAEAEVFVANLVSEQGDKEGTTLNRVILGKEIEVETVETVTKVKFK
jgi:hypothetical protein